MRNNTYRFETLALTITTVTKNLAGREARWDEVAHSESLTSYNEFNGLDSQIYALEDSANVVQICADDESFMIACALSMDDAVQPPTNYDDMGASTAAHQVSTRVIIGIIPYLTDVSLS